MANIVLVHGAWHGGWCYRDLAALLRSQGHAVFTPTHTGVGERAHQANEAITLETHVRDVQGCIESEELDDVLLCGHSYGGMVITQLAERIPEKIKTLVYLDAFVPENGDSLIDLLQTALVPEVAEVFMQAFRGNGEVDLQGMMPPIPAEMFGIAEKNRPWVDRRCVPQALATFEMPALLTGKAQAVANKVFILADGWDPSPFRYFAEKYASDPSWQVVKLPSSHDVMVDLPEELAKELLKHV
ncbi:alpha/beta fold hydrolase [Granulosicoccus antarcticus]|uniref:Pyrethroid hydrolase n=1 Tax=Granulosicoccus antarcticus IMCC3135 TaxID=1192854 RepID=A0A2Z2NR79_9GAMM|nr:alpha/beta hydrolase [Granulosicoccus antarcticus]ASJ73843.1 Pyrethroid hydrolase [Granulosicoccus antarcticus IMCC3135]